MGCQLILAFRFLKVHKFIPYPSFLKCTNGYKDPSIQIGDLLSISDYLEHTAVLSQLLKEKRKLEKKTYNNIVGYRQCIWVKCV